MPKFNTKLSRREKRYLQTLKRLLFVRYRNISKLAIPLVILTFVAYIVSALFITNDKIHSLVKDFILTVAGGLTLALVYWRAKNDSKKLDLEIKKADNDRIKLNQEIGKNIKDRFNDAIKNLSDKDNVGIRMHGVRMLIEFIKEAYKDYGTDKYENNLYKEYGKNSFDILIYHLQKLSKEQGEAFEKHQVDVVLKNMNEILKDKVDKPFELADVLLFAKYTKNKKEILMEYKKQTWDFSMSRELQEVVNLLFGDEKLRNIRKLIKEEYQLKYYPILHKIHLEGIKTTTKLYLDNIDFSNARFICSNIDKLIFQNSSLDGANFNGCQFWECSFEKTNLFGTLFINSMLLETDFKGTFFSLSDFSYSYLNSISNFSTANLVSNNEFQNVNITGIINKELKDKENTNTLRNARIAIENGAIFEYIEIPNFAIFRNEAFYYDIHNNLKTRGKYVYKLKMELLPTVKDSDSNDINEYIEYLEDILYDAGFYTDEMEKDGKINPKFKYD